jgi:hypothetical protein
MASSKDTFESHTFAANTFACGTFRGLGVDVAVTLFAIFLTGHAQRNVGTESLSQRNVSTTGSTQRNIGLSGDAGAGAL